MVAQASQQAWFHGLPGYDMPGGVPVEVIDFMPPQPVRQRLIRRFKDRIGTRAGSNLNPGPPANAPEVREAGGNMGWLFGISDDPLSGMPVAVEDFRPPNFDGQLTVTFDQWPREVERLLQRRQPVQELILVLPDRVHRRYVEFKLWNARVSKVNEPVAPRVAFESNLITWLTGQG